MKAYPCRCKVCRSRQTFKKLPWTYRKEKQCHCGGEYRVDEYRRNIENKKPCRCNGYHFPHRKGGVWCVHSLKEPSEQDVIDRYGPEAI